MKPIEVTGEHARDTEISWILFTIAFAIWPFDMTGVTDSRWWPVAHAAGLLFCLLMTLFTNVIRGQHKETIEVYHEHLVLDFTINVFVVIACGVLTRETGNILVKLALVAPAVACTVFTIIDVWYLRACCGGSYFSGL